MQKILYTANTYRHLYLCHLPYIKYLNSKYIIHTACNSNKEVPNANKSYFVPIERKPFNLNNIKAIFKLKKIIETEQYDMIHTHTPMGAVVTRLAALKYKKKHKLTIIYTAHGFHFFKGAPIINYILYYPIEKFLSKYTDLIITINKEDYEFAKKHFKTKIEYLPGIGFNKQKFSQKITKEQLNKFKIKNDISNKDYIISYVAEISKRKRQLYLLKTFKNYTFTNEKILLIGDQYDCKKINKYLKKYNLENNIKLIDFNDNIPMYLNISNIVISVSKQEGLPLNIMEAMFLEKPIIVTNCRGNRDLITNKKNGIVVDINNKKELLNAIEFIKNNPSIAKKLGKENKKIIDIYSIDNTLNIMKKIYSNYLDN